MTRPHMAISVSVAWDCAGYCLYLPPRLSQSPGILPSPSRDSFPEPRFPCWSLPWVLRCLVPPLLPFFPGSLGSQSTSSFTSSVLYKLVHTSWIMFPTTLSLLQRGNWLREPVSTSSFERESRVCTRAQKTVLMGTGACHLTALASVFCVVKQGEENALRFLSETLRPLMIYSLSVFQLSLKSSPWPFCSLGKFLLFQPCTCLEPFAWNVFSPVLCLHNFFLSFWSQLKGRFPVAFPSHSFIPQSHPLPWLCLTIFRALNTASECLFIVPLSASPPDANCLRVGVLSLCTAVSLAPRTGSNVP